MKRLKSTDYIFKNSKEVLGVKLPGSGFVCITDS